MEDFETIDKLAPIDLSTYADKDYQITIDKVDTGPAYDWRGWCDQMHIFNYKPLTIIEMGDYSMLVKESYTPSRVTDVKGNKVVESITTSEGTILYFSDKLPEELKYYNVVYVNVETDLTLTYSDIQEAYRFSTTRLSDIIDELTKETNNGESK